jgi:hypothetical protein
MREGKMPLFSIIVVHYQGTVPHDVYLRGQKCLDDQTFKDYEVLRYHDGPLLDETVVFPAPIQCTPQRFNDWGHSLRDIGIREAKGEYILHFNADNILYPSALEEIAREIRRPSRLKDETGKVLDANDMIIFPVKMWGLVIVMERSIQVRPRNAVYTILSGNPPQVGFLDCMQLVMKRELWLSEGGWRDKSERSDGFLYQEFAQKHGYRHVGPILGEHF